MSDPGPPGMTGPAQSRSTVLDSGLFLVFDDERRVRYVEALGAVVRTGG